jgi:hypothetical protein
VFIPRSSESVLCCYLYSKVNFFGFGSELFGFVLALVQARFSGYAVGLGSNPSLKRRASSCRLPYSLGLANRSEYFPVPVRSLSKIMKHSAPSLALALLLTACAAQAPSQGYRPANYAGAPWVITGSVNLLTGSASIDINSQRAAEGKLSLITGDGEFAGSYQGKSVNASCITKSAFTTVTTCFVFIGGEKAATLTF